MRIFLLYRNKTLAFDSTTIYSVVVPKYTIYDLLLFSKDDMVEVL